jgi:hypothetical protein
MVVALIWIENFIMPSSTSICAALLSCKRHARSMPSTPKSCDVKANGKGPPKPDTPRYKKPDVLG